MLVKCEVNGRVTEENNVVSVSDKQNFIDLLDLDLSEFEKQFDLIESEPVKDHSQILFSLYEQIDEVDFRNEAGFLNDDQKLLQKHFLVTCVEKILETADKNNWGVCRNHNFIYLYNGEYWSCVESQDFQIFLGKAAEKMGVYKFDARLYTFRRQLLQQFLSVSRLPKPQQNDNSVLINLKNGTFEIDGNKMHLRKPDRNDFLTYQLPFPYDEKAVSPIFDDYLNTVLPDINRQKILAEYLGYLFIKTSVLKLEKSLVLYGTGANGKSVFFEIVNALLGGTENVSNFSLQNLTNENGYFRSMLANKLVNYASEINGKLETSIFKQLVSGEPVEARLPYGEPFTLTNYAKLIFNCNELPKDVEVNNAFFRRFLIIPFDVTIPENKQDKQLASKIINNELSGVFNWVLDGLKRLLQQKNFTQCDAVDNILNKYKRESNTVALFIDERYSTNTDKFIPLSKLYSDFKSFCKDDNYIPVTKRNFSDRIRNLGILIERKNYGMAVKVERIKFSTSDNNAVS
jgi:putative DNA primase/helicase